MLLAPVMNETVLAQLPKRILRFGFYASITDAGNISEIDASFKHWVEAVQKNTKADWFSKAEIQYTIYKTKLELVTNLRKGNLDFMNFSTIDFFGLNLQKDVVPILTPSKRVDTIFDKYLLVGTIQSAINNISELSNTGILIPVTYSHDLMNIWIKVALKEKLSKKMFGSVKIIESGKTENETLHAVFFRNAELAVVREGTYLFACELNPQLKTNLKIIAESPDLINNFLGRTLTADPRYSNVLINEGLKLHTWIEGKQLLNLMQSECMHTVKLENMLQTETLISKYNKYFN